MNGVTNQAGHLTKDIMDMGRVFNNQSGAKAARSVGTAFFKNFTNNMKLNIPAVSARTVDISKPATQSSFTKIDISGLQQAKTQFQSKINAAKTQLFNAVNKAAMQQDEMGAIGAIFPNQANNLIAAACSTDPTGLSNIFSVMNAVKSHVPNTKVNAVLEQALSSLQSEREQARLQVQPKSQALDWENFTIGDLRVFAAMSEEQIFQADPVGRQILASEQAAETMQLNKAEYEACYNAAGDTGAKAYAALARDDKAEFSELAGRVEMTSQSLTYIRGVRLDASLNTMNINDVKETLKRGSADRSLEPSRAFKMGLAA